MNQGHGEFGPMTSANQFHITDMKMRSPPITFQFMPLATYSLMQSPKIAPTICAKVQSIFFPLFMECEKKTNGEYSNILTHFCTKHYYI